jgi:hypothetical protein
MPPCIALPLTVDYFQCFFQGLASNHLVHIHGMVIFFDCVRLNPKLVSVIIAVLRITRDAE